jgi:hypothetical protein
VVSCSCVIQVVFHHKGHKDHKRSFHHNIDPLCASPSLSWLKAAPTELSGLKLCVGEAFSLDFFHCFFIFLQRTTDYGLLTKETLLAGDPKSLLPHLITRNCFQESQIQLSQPALDVAVSMPTDIGQLVRCSMDEQTPGLKTGLLQKW